MRLTLAIVLTVAQLASPWLCCCGPLRPWLVPEQPTPTSVASPPTVEDHGSCPHCKKDTPKPATEQTPKTPTSPRSPADCPCCAEMSAALLADKPQVPTVDHLLVTIAVEPAEPVRVESVCVRSLVGLRELPHMSAYERLFAHHVLRC